MSPKFGGFSPKKFKHNSEKKSGTFTVQQNARILFRPETFNIRSNLLNDVQNIPDLLSKASELFEKILTYNNHNNYRMIGSACNSLEKTIEDIAKIMETFKREIFNPFKNGKNEEAITQVTKTYITTVFKYSYEKIAVFVRALNGLHISLVYSDLNETLKVIRSYGQRILIDSYIKIQKLEKNIRENLND